MIKQFPLVLFDKTTSFSDTFVGFEIFLLYLIAFIPNICFNPIVHGGSEVALKHVRKGRGWGVNLLLHPPLAKIQTTKVIYLKLGTLIK